MKLNNENYDQSSFPYSRVMLSLLWLRMKKFTPDELRVSYKDMIIIVLEHLFPNLINYVRSVVHKLLLRLNKVRLRTKSLFMKNAISKNIAIKNIATQNHVTKKTKKDD